MEFIKKNYNTTITKENKGVVWIEHSLFSKQPGIRHAYSTRIGGVSSGVCSSMNLRNCEYDTPENYRKNMEIFCSAAGFDINKIVATQQTHTTNVEIVKEEDCPRGTLFEKQYQNVDGLITDVPGIVLVTSFADCIPLYFYDKKKHVIGMSHSGWRGTVGKIGEVTINKMSEVFGSRAEDILVGIGPGICGDCYEVSADLYEKFADNYTDNEMRDIFKNGREGHYQLDLWKANYYLCLKLGIKKENISVTDICTRCNSDFLFSHRVMGEKRGNQCGFISLN